jgi:hypothetical protein
MLQNQFRVGSVPMGTLKPDIPSEELTRALNEAATIMRGFRQPVLMPEHLLLAFLDNKDYAAHGLLVHFAEKRGFRLDELTRAVEDQARARRASDVDFDFVAQDGTRVPLGDEMLTVLDEDGPLPERVTRSGRAPKTRWKR